jgi:hypothetical protein
VDVVKMQRLDLRGVLRVSRQDGERDQEGSAGHQLHAAYSNTGLELFSLPN